MSVDENVFFREDVRESEERRRVMLKTTMDGFLRTDMQGRILEVNETYCRMSGYSEQELLTMKILDIEAVHDTEMIAANIRKTMELGPNRFESVHRRKDGSLFDVEISAQYQPIAGGQAVVFVRDITDRKRAEQALRQSEAYLAEAQRLSHTGSWAFDVASSKYVYLSEECFRIFGLNAQEGLPTREAVSRLIHPEDWDRVNEDFEKLLGEKRDTSSEFRVLLPSGTVKHVQTIRHPVLNGAGDVVQVVGTAVDITERKQAEEELRESEMRFRAFLDHAADAICVFDEQHKIVEANREACEGHGYTREELIGMTPQDFDPDMDAARLQWINDRIAAGEVCTFETRNRRKDGTVFPVEVRVRPLQIGGRQLHLASARDITDRKQAEEALRLASIYNRSLIEASLDPLVTIDREGKISDVNAATERITGYTRSELIGTDFSDYFTEPEKTRVGYQQAFDQGFIRDYELEIRNRNGEITPVIYNASVYRDDTGKVIGIFAAARDITEHIRTEEERRQNAERFRAIADYTYDWENWIGVDGKLLWVNPAVERITGYSVGECMVMPDFPIPIIAEADRETVSRQIREAVQGSSRNDFEFRVRHKDGRLAWVAASWQPIYDQKGARLGFRSSIRDIAERKRAEEEVLRLKDMLADDNRYLFNELRSVSGDEIIGSDFGLKAVMEMIKQVAPIDSPVLLLGETGTGKEVIANAIHYSSRRKDGPLIKVNCGAIPETLLDSELFGHEKGAFTGAVSQKRGRFERANKGSIFLDEIGELPAQAQVRLLRVLQTKEIERVGGTTSIPVDVRIISATNRNLEKMIASGRFREDLWFRLNVFPIMIPPLRQRREDIPALVHHFIDRKSKEMKLTERPALAPGALDRLMVYDWPGNVRELENMIERALIQSRGGMLSFETLSAPQVPMGREVTRDVGRNRTALSLDEINAQHIRQALETAGGRINGPGGAAQILGLNPNTLRSRMNKLGIPFGRRSWKPSSG